MKTLTPLLPGLALGALVAAAAFGIRMTGLPGLASLSPLMLAILLGMAVRNTVGRPEATRAGLAASLRRPLRTGIVLLGLQVTLGEILGIGIAGLALLAFALAATFVFSTHDEHLMAHAKRIVRLVDGRVVEDRRVRA